MLDALTGMAAMHPIPAVLRGEQIPQWSPEMETTVKRFHHDSHDQLRRYLQDVIDAYNFGRGLKTLKGLTPYEFICKQWASGGLGYWCPSLSQR